MTRAAPQVAFDATPAAATIQRACACGGKAGGSPCAACAADERLRVQPKLVLGRPGDAYEKEADRLAETVLADRPTPLTGPLAVTPLVQRQAADEEDEEETVQTKAAGRPDPAALGHAAAAVARGGRPLSGPERQYYEPRFGRDLSEVRLHDGPGAAAAARGIGARAYTLGRNIGFAPGQYAPETPGGRRLLAHELVHTIQQGGAGATRVQRTESGGTWGGFWRNIGAAFSIGAYFSDEDLQGYLTQIEELGTPAGDYDSDNKALEVARRINGDFPLYGHDDTVALRKILILEMQAGATMGDEEEAILGLLTSLDALEVAELFRAPNALSPEDLRSDIDGDNRDRLDVFLNAMGIAAEGMETRAPDENCSAEERTALRQSVALAQGDIDRAVGALEDHADSAQVRHSFFLAFRVDEPTGAQVSDMVARLRAVRRGTANAHYICDHGEASDSLCAQGARGYASLGPSGNGIGLCFMAPRAAPAAGTAEEEEEEPRTRSAPYNLAEEEDDTVRSMLITHEAAHFYLGVDDNGYFTDTCHETSFAMSCMNGTRENCGTSGRPPDNRFDNADSYACFVHYLARLADFGGTEREEPAEGESLEERAEGLRGRTLSLRMHYPQDLIDIGSDLHLANPEGDDVIVLMGEPENSGFSHDWSIEAEGVRLPLTETSTSLGGSGTFARSHSAATVPDATRARLMRMARGGTERAEVVVRSTIYRGAPADTNVETRLTVRLQTEPASFGIIP